MCWITINMNSWAWWMKRCLWWWNVRCHSHCWFHCMSSILQKCPPCCLFYQRIFRYKAHWCLSVLWEKFVTQNSTLLSYYVILLTFYSSIICVVLIIVNGHFLNIKNLTKFLFFIMLHVSTCWSVWCVISVLCMPGPTRFFSLLHWLLSITFCWYIWFLPRCMECSRGIAMGILSVCSSVCPSVRPSNAWIVTKQKRAMFRFWYHMKEHLS